MTKQEKEEYSSQTIQGLNERVKQLEKKIAKLETLIKGK